MVSDSKHKKGGKKKNAKASGVRFEDQEPGTATSKPGNGTMPPHSNSTGAPMAPTPTSDSNSKTAATGAEPAIAPSASPPEPEASLVPAPEDTTLAPSNGVEAESDDEAASPPTADADSPASACRSSLQPLTSGQERDRQEAKFSQVSEEEKMRLMAGYKRLCSDATLQASSTGFFKTFDSQVIETVTDAQFQEFSKLTSDEERVFFVWQIPTVHSTVAVKPFSRGKSAEAAQEAKQNGNKNFQQKKYRLAVLHYSRMVIRAPNPGSGEGGDLLSLGYANRSAALLHLEEYKHCLRDIELALGAGYPRRLHYKLLDRRATCQLKLGEVTAAQKTLQELQQSLQHAELDQKKHDTWQRDVQTKIDGAAKQTDFKPIMQLQEEEDPVPSLASTSSHFITASPALDVTHSAEGGRYAVAAANISPGELLVVEKPYASVLNESKASSHCLHCMKRVLVAFPCPNCSGVLYCSPECVAAGSSYHCWECSVLDVIRASGMSVLCQLALRLITVHNIEFFRTLRPELEKARDSAARPSTDASGATYDPASYLAVHQLVTLAELREPGDFFHRTLMAALLVKYLRATGYFGEHGGEEAPSDRPLSQDELLVGGLLLRHLQLLQFNAHEVGEYVMMEPGQYKQSRSVNIGVAVYPTVSFFNHSCEGGISRCFVGNTLIVRSVMSIAAGQPIHENYGPVYSSKGRKDRRHWLDSRYWFDCACTACDGDWPDFDKLDHTKVELRCQSCGGGLWNEVSGKNAKGDCNKCGHKNNIVQMFRELSSVTEHYNSALKIMDEGEPKRALRLMYRYIEQVKSLVVKPNRDLTLCQDAARMCLASLGSMHCIRGGRS